MRAFHGVALATLLAVTTSGCLGGGRAESRPATQKRTDQSRDMPLSAAVGRPLAHEQRKLAAHAGSQKDDTSFTISVLDSMRSLRTGRSGVLLHLRDIGVLRVSCDALPNAEFQLTRFAAGEGPPVVHHVSARTHGRTSLVGFVGSEGGLTGRLGTMTIPEPHPTRQVLHHYDFFGGGEAFQFTVTITALLTPTATRCDLLAEATVVTHGPFYRDARASSLDG